MRKRLRLQGQDIEVELLEQTRDAVRFMWQGQEYAFRLVHQDGRERVLEHDHQQTLAIVGEVDREGLSRVWVAGQEVTVGHKRQQRKDTEGMESSGAPKAPLSGLVVSVAVKVGDVVAKGATLAVMEAMKMQLTIAAPKAGVVKLVHVQAGQQVQEGTELVTLDAEDAA